MNKKHQQIRDPSLFYCFVNFADHERTGVPVFHRAQRGRSRVCEGNPPDVA